MRRDFILWLLIAFAIVLAYRSAFFNFFAQDDFILINYFSQNGFFQDISHVFGQPTVTHWRPVHNLYFLIAGNIFDKFYFGYHLLTFAFHLGASFLIYKVVKKKSTSGQAGMIAGLIYGIHPAHFVSLFWISGAATIVGFFFLIASFYSFLLGKKMVTIGLYILALGASEAMLVGVVLFFLSAMLFGTLAKNRGFLVLTVIVSIIFSLIKLWLTPQATFVAYPIEFSSQVLGAIGYYLVRVAGFAETDQDLLPSLLLAMWLLILAVLSWNLLKKKQGRIGVLFSVATISVGLLPFILIPSHLSAHYMNVAVFGFSLLVAQASVALEVKSRMAMVAVFAIIAAFSIGLTTNNNWVTKRSELARSHLSQVERENPSPFSTIVFADSQPSTSEEAYIALGTGEAIKFWFGEKNYQTCFTRFENCFDN